MRVLNAMRGLSSSLALIVLLTAPLVGCGDDSNTMAGPDENPEDLATIVGRVDHTATASPFASSGGPSGSSGSVNANAVAVGTVNSDGTANILVEGELNADGSYRIEGVPSGRSDLQVFAMNGTEVTGQTFIYEKTRAGAEHTVAPITAESTARAWVAAELEAEGKVSDASEVDEEVSLFLRMDEERASVVAGSETNLQTLAQGYARAEEGMTGIYADAGANLDASSRATVLQGAAVGYAHELHAGMSHDAAWEAFAEASLDALIQAGATAEAVAYATATTSTSLDMAAATSLSDNARLAASRGAALLNLRARERMASELTGTFGSSASAVATANAEARTRIRGASTPEEVRGILTAAIESGNEVVISLALSSITDLVVRSEVETAVKNAQAKADLSARLEGRTTASAMRQAIAEYRTELMAAAEAVVQAMPDGSNASAEAYAKLLVAVAGGPRIS